MIFNLKPVTLKLGLSEETLNQVVACWQSEAKQLEMILLRWQEKQENTDDYAVLRKALEGLQPEGKNSFSRRLPTSVSFEKLSKKTQNKMLPSVSRCLEPQIKHSHSFLICYMKPCFRPFEPAIRLRTFTKFGNKVNLVQRSI